MLHEIKKSELQKLAEGEVSNFKDALGPFVTAAEVTRMPMMFARATPPDHSIIFVNQAFLNLTGFEEHEVMGQSFFALIEPETDPEMLAEIQTAFKGGRDLESLVRYSTKDDSSIWITLNIAPVRNRDGKILQFFASFIDVTARKQEEEGLQHQIEELKLKLEVLAGPKRRPPASP